jgi:hypothetical protein
VDGEGAKAEPAAAAPAPARHPHPPARKRLAIPAFVVLSTPSSPTSPVAAIKNTIWLALKAAASIGKKHGSALVTFRQQELLYPGGGGAALNTITFR